MGNPLQTEQFPRQMVMMIGWKTRCPTCNMLSYSVLYICYFTKEVSVLWMTHQQLLYINSSMSYSHLLFVVIQCVRGITCFQGDGQEDPRISANNRMLQCNITVI